ncbi:MAG: hypothetical protein AAGE61_18400 [Pseudomonadota bacterium]
MTVQIPNDWQPRGYQRRLYNSFGHGKRYQRGSVIWHRRAGKGSTVFNLTARDMFKRTGTYWHLFPEQAQARRAIWNGIDKTGRRIIDQFLPPSVRRRISSQEMLIETVTGSVWQMAGSDNYDSLVGSNPVGVVFDEWPLADPQALEYIRPILRENDGWMLFIGTPRGRNHAYRTHVMAQKNDDWFDEILTYRDTGVLTEEDIQAERAEGMSESKIEQEFLCSFEAEADEQFIPTELVARAQIQDAFSTSADPMVIGVDVARFGDDKTVIYPRRGRDARTMPFEVYSALDTMQVAARVAEAINRYSADQVFIDEGAMGAGVVDRLYQLGFTEVLGVNFGAVSDRAINEKGALASNKRSEMWAILREWLKGPAALPDDDRLAFELLAPNYSYDANNAVVLEKKADMKKRGVASPDIADALALTFAYPVVAHAIRDAEDEREDENYDPIWETS